MPDAYLERMVRMIALAAWHKSLLSPSELDALMSISDMGRLASFHDAYNLCRIAPTPERASGIGSDVYDRYAGEGIAIAFRGTDDYPRQLCALRSPPCILAVRGDIRVVSAPQAAIVGSRTLHPAATDFAGAITDQILDRGYVITSGGALGADALAHEAAIAAGMPTVVVAGTGPDRCYPPENRHIFEAACANGAVVSQFPLGGPPRQSNFPRRNAIIAGLSDFTLILSCRPGSGALHTATHAAAAARPVLVAAMPGFSELTEGGLALVKSGRARLISTADDLRPFLTRGREAPRMLPLDFRPVRGTDEAPRPTGTTRIKPAGSGTTPGRAPSSTAAQQPPKTHDAQLTPLQQSIVAAIKSSALPVTRELLRQSLGLPPAFDESILELELSGIVSSVAGAYVLGTK